MIPSVDTRLASMASAVTGVLIPALAGTNPFAEEQAALLVGHLQVLRGHQPVTDEFERLDHHRSRALARALLADATGGPDTEAAARSLREHLESAVPVTMTALRWAQDELSGAITSTIEAIGVDGSRSSVEASTRTVLAFEHPHSLRVRSYFSAMGYENGTTTVPSIDEMMDEFRSLYGAQEATT